jgi:NAD(P)-dependent dehydrogenase (short-subunit alcohol dehydrogenase family)
MATSLVPTLHFEPYNRLSPSQWRKEYEGKTILITGGGYGIGVFIAKAFAQANVAAIILAGRTKSSLESTTAELSKAFPTIKISYDIVDIAARDSVKSFFAALSASPDILVNNAGYLSEPQNFVEADLDEWWKSFEINVLGTVTITQAYLQHRVKHNPQGPGVVIALNTFAAYGVRAPYLSGYTSSKAALGRVWENLPMDVPETQARFISVNPGAVKTAMFHKSKLEGMASFPTTEPQLAAEFLVWTATEQGAFLNGRLAWANWDLDELLAKKDEIVEKQLLFSDFKEA